MLITNKHSKFSSVSKMNVTNFNGGIWFHFYCEIIKHLLLAWKILHYLFENLYIFNLCTIFRKIKLYCLNLLLFLGQLQAEYTGKRLNELNLPYTEIIQSTMTRAQETGSIISKFSPEVRIVPCIFFSTNNFEVNILDSCA